MIDRMFLAEEQQSLLKAQADLKMQSELDMQQTIETNLQKMYSETPTEIDIKPELLPEPLNKPKNITQTKHFHETFPKTEEFTVKTETEKNEFDENPDFNIKCGLNYFSDDSCDSSNFQDYEETTKFEENYNKNENFNTTDKKEQKNNQESYNTTKIIGNFEIEINNKGCNNQESYTKNFRQKIIDNKDINVHSHIKTNERKIDESFENRGPDQTDDYDEWLCIQRELGYFPENKDAEKVPESNETNPEYKPKSENDKKSHKRSSTDSNRLETLKKFRVEKHNSKSKKSGSIIGEVKFEVRIEHKKVFPENKKDASEFKQNPSKRSFEYSKSENEQFTTGKRMCGPNFNPAFNIKTEDNQSEIVEDIFDRSIDEQVQSAIDSILNLQQITSMGTEKGESSKEKNSEFGSKMGDDGNDSTLALDEAVKSILS